MTTFDIEQSRQQNKQAASRRSDQWILLANERENDISKLLFSITALIFTISLPFITNSSNFSDSQKMLLILTWVTDIISLLFGAVSVYMSMKYFEKLARIDNRSEEIWSVHIDSVKEYSSVYKKDIENQDKKALSASFIPLLLQGVFLTLSIVLLFTIATSVLMEEKKCATHTYFRSLPLQNRCR